MSRLKIEKEDAVWVVRFHNPPHGYMDQQTAAELTVLLDEVEASDTVRAVILTGDHDGVFIRHYDVTELAHNGAVMAAKGLRFSAERPVPETDVHRCLLRMETLPVPFIAAINGLAMGGGMEMALACDIRLAQDGPFDLGLPEVKIGLLPGAGGTQRLTRLIGQSQAMAMILLGNTITPLEAARIGLVMECVAGDVLQRAREVAARIVGHSALATTHIKRLVRSVGVLPVEEGLAMERTLFCDVMVAPQSLDAMNAMLSNDSDIRDAGHPK
ncbi:MAG: enoyl-CoA hydratase/carnithine racemase [Bacteroidia bacterium]|jgi:enoyl-CoA hydratase/carnithine racemase